MEESKKILEEPGYWITKNDFKLLFGADESDFTEDGEELIKIEKNHFDEILSQNKLNQDKYRIKMNINDPRYPIIELVEREYGKKKNRKRGCNI